MRLALYVHDFRLEVGHSNSLIELVRHLPKETLSRIKEIEVVSCRATDLKILFPEYSGKLIWKKIPLESAKPSFVKSFLFQIWTFLYNKLFQPKDTFRIGIGICCLNVDAVSIQFIHHQWTEKGLEMEKGYLLRKLYKKFLFAYYEACERYLFSKKGIKFFSPAVFLTDFLKTKFNNIDAVTVYSGVNLSRFELDSRTKSELKNELTIKYPVLSSLDITRPIYLFVGAYERKGIAEALELLKKENEPQFIVVGSPSAGRKIEWPEGIKIYPIKFSKEIADFYSLADAFIFPTIYEPFGLVLFEAMAMGITVITRRENVGASELLEKLPEIYFSDNQDFHLPSVKPLTYEDRERVRRERLRLLGDISWNKAGAELARFLF